MTAAPLWLDQLTRIFGWRVDDGSGSALLRRLKTKGHAPHELAALAERALGGDEDAEILLASLGAVHETYFFRSPEILLDAVRLAGMRHSGPEPLQVWSAGCATGEEAYTLALLLEEMVGDAYEVLGTDADTHALELARAGKYTEWSLRRTASPFATRLHRGSDGSVLVPDTVRRRVRFERLNLMSESALYPSPSGRPEGFDLIVCRNVLVYFDFKAAETVLGRLVTRLGPAGILATGSLDVPSGSLPLSRIEDRPAELYEHARPRPPRERPSSRARPVPLRPLEVAQHRAQSTPQGVAVLEIRTARPTGEGVDLQQRAVALLESGDLQGSAQAFEQALEKEWSLPLAHLGLALSLEGLSKRREAKVSAERAINLVSGLEDAERVISADGKLTVGMLRRMAAGIVERC